MDGRGVSDEILIWKNCSFVVMNENGNESKIKHIKISNNTILVKYPFGLINPSKFGYLLNVMVRGIVLLIRLSRFSVKKYTQNDKRTFDLSHVGSQVKLCRYFSYYIHRRFIDESSIVHNIFLIF